jgi:hypothetical protein
MTDEHEPTDDIAARVARQFRESFARNMATVMEAGIDAQIERLTDIAERFERKDREMAMDELKAAYDNWVASMQPIEHLRETPTYYDTITNDEAVDVMDYVAALEAEVKRLRASARPDTPPMEFEVPTDMKWPPSPPNNYNPVIFAFNPQPEPVKAEVYVWQAEQDILRAALLRNATVSVDSECEDIKVSPRAQGGWQYSHTWRCFEGVPDDTYYEDYAPEYIERLIDKLIGDGWPDAFKITESEDAK